MLLGGCRALAALTCPPVMRADTCPSGGRSLVPAACFGGDHSWDRGVGHTTDVPALNPGAWLPCPSFHCDVSLILVLLASLSLCDPGDPGDTRRHFDTTVDFLICAHPSILGLSPGISSVCGGSLRGGGPPPPVVLLLSPLWRGPGPCGCSVGVGWRGSGGGPGAGGNLEIALMK